MLRRRTIGGWQRNELTSLFFFFSFLFCGEEKRGGIIVRFIWHLWIDDDDTTGVQRTQSTESLFERNEANDPFRCTVMDSQDMSVERMVSVLIGNLVMCSFRLLPTVVLWARDMGS